MTLSLSDFKLPAVAAGLANGFRTDRLSAVMLQAKQQLSAVMQASRTRRQLAELDEAALQDIGVSQAEALAEARRQPWDRV